MSHSPYLGSPVTHTRLRTPASACDASGMCSACVADCDGPCEIGLSALRGAEALLPFAADINQFASEKRYPVDLSSFSINGRVFGAFGAPEDPLEATYRKIDLGSSLGVPKPVPTSAPFILPAMAKLAWREYFAGAALFGVPAVVGEDVIAKDPGLQMDGHRVTAAPLVSEMLEAYRRYNRGLGDIVLQANYDDEYHGLLEYAIPALGVRSVELKLGQAAKGIQGMGRLPDIETARRFKRRGWLVLPDPDDERVAEAYARGQGPAFEKIGRLPMWTPEALARRVAALRELGAERVMLKTGPFDPRDLKAVLEVASEGGVDLVTLDGAGGGTGHSPVKMMNEWGVHAVELCALARRILEGFEREGRRLPPLALAGGFATEDHVYKGLALGSPYVKAIALGRASMAAAMVGRRFGEAFATGSAPKGYERFGADKDAAFADTYALKALYGEESRDLPAGAVGVFSYLNRVADGLRMLMALSRKFRLDAVAGDDIVALTEEAARVGGVVTYQDLLPPD